MRTFMLLIIMAILLTARSSFTPLTPARPHDVDKATLGKALFFDPLLSSDGTYSCARCHDLESGGSDAKKIAVGVKERIGEFNTPTILNASLNMTLGWVSSIDSMGKGAKSAFLNPLEMDGDIDESIAYLNATSTYRRMFVQSYGGVSEEAMFDAIDIYVSTLLTPSAFDRYLRGEADAISTQAKRGMRLFVTKGCVSCHNGVNLGGQMFQKFGVFDEAMLLRGSHQGRYSVTGKESDRYVFRVPPLRNVARTAPYLHDGSVPTLREVIVLMIRHQLGTTLKRKDIDALVAFLQALDGEQVDDR